MRRKLLPPEQALRLVLDRVRPLEAETIELRDALGRVLAAGVVSADDVPGFDNSAMDGFAVRAADTKGAGKDRPATLAVRGESRAGRPASVAVAVERGQAVRISTGAMVPEGADAIVRIEDCSVRGDSVDVTTEVTSGNDLRGAGDDIRAGDRVLERGARLGPAELGVLASVGVAQVSCARRPRLAVVITGDELVEPGRPLEPGQIRDSNAYSVPAQAARAGGEVTSVRVVPDDYEATLKALAAGLASDALVVCGGVSVGEHDHVKAALAELGTEQVFWGVAMRPGHPTWFGVRGRDGSGAGAQTLAFGLPGNPVSAMVTFHLFARPALAAMLGTKLTQRRANAVMDKPYRKRPGRAHVVRCRLEARDDGWHVRPTKEQGSHVLTSMLEAQAFALLEIDRGDVVAGERVEIELL